VDGSPLATSSLPAALSDLDGDIGEDSVDESDMTELIASRSPPTSSWCARIVAALRTRLTLCEAARCAVLSERTFNQVAFVPALRSMAHLQKKQCMHRPASAVHALHKGMRCVGFANPESNHVIHTFRGCVAVNVPRAAAGCNISVLTLQCVSRGTVLPTPGWLPLSGLSNWQQHMRQCDEVGHQFSARSRKAYSSPSPMPCHKKDVYAS
jgi:hypothetical protein